MLTGVCKMLKDQGFRVVVGFNFEHASAKMSFKSTGGEVIQGILQRMKAEASSQPGQPRGLGRTFQRSASDPVMAMSGKVVVLACKGADVVCKEFHWHQPPFSLPDGSTGSLAAALARMPIRAAHREDWCTLGAVSDCVIGMCCQDKASNNMAFINHVRSVVSELDSHMLFDEKWCGLHNCNNMKVTSKDMCELCAKYYSLSALMKTGSYMRSTVVRLHSWISAELVRETSVGASSEVVAANRSIVEALYDLGAQYHARGQAGGSKSTRSNLWYDLEELLELDRSGWISPKLICFC